MRRFLHQLSCISRHFLVVILAGFLAACGSSESDGLNIVVVGEPDDPFERGVHLSEGGQLVRASTAEGLVAFDALGRVIPALADRWIVTDDGQSYIFRLRDGTWRDGTEITAREAHRALRSQIRALRGTSLGLDLSGIEETREMAGRVIEIRLNRPMPHFLQLLAQPELGLRHEGAGAGPMTLEKEEDLAVLVPIRPEELGLPAMRSWDDRARPLRLSAMSGAKAVERFNNGDASLVLGGTFDDFPYTSSVGILRGTIQLDPVVGLFGLRVTHTDGFLSEPANREAISMAIDRRGLIAPFGLDGWEPSTRIVSLGQEDDLETVGERWAEMTIEDRRALAAARVARWREDLPEGQHIRLRIALPSGQGAEMLFRQLAKDLATVGLVAEHVAPGDPADLRLVDTVARYPHSMWFLNRLNCRVEKAPCSKEADERVGEALKAEDPAERAALIAEAEAELTASNVFIPFGSPIRWSLVRGTVEGFQTNAWGWHPLMPMALLPK